MTLRGVTINLRRFFEVRPGESRRLGLMAAFLFFLLAANNVIKVVRDSLFLSRFSITQLPYVYLLAALLAGVVIGVYSRYTAKLSLSRLIPGSLAFVISNVILFWLTRTPVLLGKDGTEYGEKQNDYRVELRVRYHFDF